MQPPTCTNVKIRSTADAHIIFHAVAEDILPMITRRLDTEERQELRTGNCYVWEERGSDSEATGMGIERWTDGQSWGPSRVREDFLFYTQRDTHAAPDVDEQTKPVKDRGPLKYGKSVRRRSQAPPGRQSSTPANGVSSSSRISQQNQLVKQTYSVFTKLPGDPESKQPRKWHLTAYFTQATLDDLRIVAQIPELMGIVPPQDRYRSAKVGKKRDPSDVASMPGTSVLFRDQDHLPSPMAPTLEPSNPNGIYQSSPSISPATSHNPYSGLNWPASSGVASAPPSASPSRYSYSPTSYFTQSLQPHPDAHHNSSSNILMTHHRDHSYSHPHPSQSSIESPRSRNISMPASHSHPSLLSLRQQLDQNDGVIVDQRASFLSGRLPGSMDASQIPDTPPEEHAALPPMEEDGPEGIGLVSSSSGLGVMAERALPPLHFIRPDRLPARNPEDERALWALTGRFNR